MGLPHCHLTIATKTWGDEYTKKEEVKSLHRGIIRGKRETKRKRKREKKQGELSMYG